jgi:hypothetical protein
MGWESIGAVMWPLQLPSRAILAGMVLLMLVPNLPRPVYGWTRVEGQKDFVTVEARDASVAEVLAALSARLGLHIREPKPGDRVISGTFRGPLQRVISRLLVGSDYVVKYSENTIEIIVLASSKSGQSASTVNDTSIPAGAARHGRRTRNLGVSAAAQAQQR